MTRVLGLGWLATRTADPEGMTRFAAEVLGLQPTGSAGEHVTFTLDNADTFEVYGPGAEGGGHPVPGPIGAFRVEDATEVHRAARALGYEVSELRTDAGFVWFYVSAPDGHHYEIYESAS